MHPTRPIRNWLGSNIEGTTTLAAIVTPEGTTTAIAIAHSMSERLEEKLRPAGFQLDQQAAAAVAKWKFDSATFQDKPILLAIQVKINFRLYY